MQLVGGVRYILENTQGLSDPNCYHEFCRLLARLKANYQLSELVKIEDYPETIALITKFTVTSLQVKYPSKSSFSEINSVFLFPRCANALPILFTIF